VLRGGPHEVGRHGRVAPDLGLRGSSRLGVLRILSLFLENFSEIFEIFEIFLYHQEPRTCVRVELRCRLFVCAALCRFNGGGGDGSLYCIHSLPQHPSSSLGSFLTSLVVVYVLYMYVCMCVCVCIYIYIYDIL